MSKEKWAGVDPHIVLGVGPNASDEEIRAAYLKGVKTHPPDRDPDRFQEIRDAYEVARNPRRRAQRMLECADPIAPFPSLLDDAADRRFVGPEPWLAILGGPPRGR